MGNPFYKLVSDTLYACADTSSGVCTTLVV